MSALRWMRPLAFAAAVLVVGGCSMFRRPGGGLAATKPEKKDATRATLEEPIDTRIAETKTKAAAPAKSTLDQATLKELMAELKELGETNPEEQRELIALVEGDPTMAGPLLKVWRNKRKYNRQHSSEGELSETDAMAQADLSSAKEGRGALRLEAAPALRRPIQQVSRDEELKSETDGELGSEDEGEGRFEDLLKNEAPAKPAKPSASRNQGASDWDSHVRQLIAETQRALASDTVADKTQMEVYLRLLYVMTGQRDKAVAPIEGVDRAEAEYWKHTLWALADYFDTEGLPNGPERASEAVKRLVAASQQLRQKAALQVKNLSFCQRIQSYGSFDRFPGHPNYEFTAGKEVLLYSEVENFHSELTQERQYQTVLHSSIVIVDDQDQEIWRQQFEPTDDVCQNRRQDYFQTNRFTIPAKAKPGEYTVKLTVEDQLAEKSAEATIGFRVK